MRYLILALACLCGMADAVLVLSDHLLLAWLLDAVVTVTCER